jgi:hypothetical protein
MTTVGEFKKKIDALSDIAPLEFWLVLDEIPVQVNLSEGESVRFPDGRVAEIIFVRFP